MRKLLNIVSFALVVCALLSAASSAFAAEHTHPGDDDYLSDADPAYPNGTEPLPEPFETEPAETLFIIDPVYIFTLPAPAETRPETESAASSEAPSAVPSETPPKKGADWLIILCLAVAAAAITFGCIQGRKSRKKTEAETILPALPPLEEEKKAQITAALRKLYHEYHIDWYCAGNPKGTCRYYGSENGYDILFYAGGFRLEIPESHTAAEKRFYFDTSFELYAHKDGSLTDLQQAYEEGLVSREAVAAAAQLHEKCQ